jgi:hypothetical protein
MEQSYIFGPGTGKTYADIVRMRDIAEQFGKSASGVPQTGMDGIHAVADALIARKNTRKADKKQDELLSQLGPTNPLVLALMGIPQSAVPQYRFGTDYHPGGPAIVGEDGPELLMLPKGAKVKPNPMTLAWDQQEAPPTTGPGALDAEMQNLSPEERAKVLLRIQQGLPPVEAITPDWYDPVGPQGNLSTKGMVQTADAGTVKSDALPYGDEKLTEGQSKDINYFRRGYAANQDLNNLEEALTQYTDNFAGNFGGVGRLFQDADYQVADRAAKEFLAMVLRKDTGAAVTNEEFKMYTPMYIPQPGDKPEKLAAKRKAREQFLAGMEMGSGTAAPLYPKARAEVSAMSDDDLLRALQGGN